MNTLDKYEYRVKTEQMLEYMGEKSYKKAAEIADSIDWRKVKNAAMLCGASEVYEYNGEYEKSREILFLAYDLSLIHIYLTNRVWKATKRICLLYLENLVLKKKEKNC